MKVAAVTRFFPNKTGLDAWYIVNELDGQFLCILNEFQIGCISRLKYVYYFTSICTSGTKPEITDLPSHMYLFLRETVYLTESAAVQG